MRKWELKESRVVVQAASHYHLQPKLVQLIASWLRPRSARVVVDGQESQPITMQDMVFQGTFFGPPFWNTKHV